MERDLYIEESSFKKDQSDPTPYHEFIVDRIEKVKNEFEGKFRSEGIKEQYSGFFSLLKLS